MDKSCRGAITFMVASLVRERLEEQTSGDVDGFKRLLIPDRIHRLELKRRRHICRDQVSL